tara:strand:+ start:2601 stop:2855 length:255 start_codon:yes stop_codon:yes gene_type:complete
MNDDVFEIHKPHKMMDWIENQVNDWAYERMQDHFGVESPEELSREQIDQVIKAHEDLIETYDVLAMGLRNVISTWENENDEYIY